MSILKLIRGKRVVPSVPQGHAASVGSEPEQRVSPRRDGSSGLALFIRYEDGSGEISQRRIRCASFDPGHDALNAYCFEREAPRQFRLDRISEAICTETGEVIALARLLESLRARGMPMDDPRLARMLCILVFVMRCDGVNQREIEALEQAVTSFALRFDGCDEMVEQGNLLSGTLAPDSRDFMRAVNWLHWRKDGAELARFLKMQLRQMIDADGQHSAEEFLLVSELAPLLDRIAQRDR